MKIKKAKISEKYYTFKFKAKWSVIVLISLILLVMFIGNKVQVAEVAEAKANFYESQYQDLKEQNKKLLDKVIEYDEVEKPTQEQSSIQEEIKKVFGSDYPKAMLLLRGKNGGCSENNSLNPQAKNVNKDGTADWGLFQINNYWHKIPPKFLLNPKINILVAHQLFLENNRRFNLWTCGRAYGI